MTYAEHLKTLGATQEDITLLDTPLARKAFDKQQAELTAATERVAAADKARTDDRATYEKWRDEQVLPEYAKMQNELIAEKGERAKAEAAIRKMQELGLIDVAKTMGYAPAEPEKKTGLPEGFDPTKYVTMDQVTQIAQSEGDAIALAQDIAAEHSALFPDKKLNFRALRAEAQAARQPVEAYWKNKYGVDAARAARESADKAAYEKRLMEQGAKEERERLATTYGNPDLRPLAPSTSPFTKRPEAGREAQPWEVGDRSNERVQRATKTILDMQSGQGGRAN